MTNPPKWLHGTGTTGLLQVRNITRLFIVTDYSGKSDIKASMLGSQSPFTVDEFDTVARAGRALEWLLDQLEGKDT